MKGGIKISSSDVFKFKERFSLFNQFNRVLKLMVECYSEILTSEIYIRSEIDKKQRKRENFYRNRLCVYLHENSEIHGLGTYIFEKECEETDHNGFTVGLLDIKVLNIQEDPLRVDTSLYFTFETKRLDGGGNDSQYIKTGLCEFIQGKYSRNMEYAGMIAFIEKGDPDLMVKKIKGWLNVHPYIITLKNLGYYDIDGFKHSYVSEHERDGMLNNISIYHLIFDYTSIMG